MKSKTKKNHSNIETCYRLVKINSKHQKNIIYAKKNFIIGLKFT